MPCATSKESFLDSYNVVVDEIKQLQPALAMHDVSVAAARRFRPIHAYLQEAARVENSGQEIYENGAFIMVDGRMYFPATGEFAESLHENQLTSSRLHHDPARYSKADHERTLLVQRSFANGATVARTTFDGVNGVHRDMVEYQYDPTTNRGKIIVHDLSQQHGLLDMTEMKQVVFQESQGLRAVIRSEKVFIATDAPVSVTHRVEVIVQEPEHIGFVDKRQVRRTDAPVPSDQIIRQANETIGFVGRRVIAETSETIRGVRRWAEARETKNIFQRREGSRIVVADRLTVHKPRTPQIGVRNMIVNHRAMFEWQRERLVSIEKTKVGIIAVPAILHLLSERPLAAIWAVEKSMKRHNKRELRIKSYELRKGKQRIKKEATRAVRIKPARVELFGKRTEKKRKEKWAKVYMRETAGGRIYTIEKPERQSGRKRMRPLKERRVDERSKLRAVTDTLVHRSERRGERWKKRRGLKPAIANTRELKLATTLAPAKERRRRQWQELASQGSTLRSWEKRKVTSLRLGLEVGTKMARNELRYYRNIRETKRTVALQFSFAWLLYRLLKTERNFIRLPTVHRRYFDKLPSEKLGIGGVNSVEGHVVALKKQVNADHEYNSLKQYESTPWILLSIIWYLTMIREGGNSNPTNPTNNQIRQIKKHKRKKNNNSVFQHPLLPWLPQQAVIFAYHS